MREPDAELDCRGLICPLPVLRARKALQSLAGGAVLRVLATDPAAPRDFTAFCDAVGHRLLESRSEDGLHTILLAKAE